MVPGQLSSAERGVPDAIHRQSFPKSKLQTPSFLRVQRPHVAISQDNRLLRAHLLTKQGVISFVRRCAFIPLGRESKQPRLTGRGRWACRTDIPPAC